MNSCTGRSLLSPFLSSLKLILGNSFQVSVIRIEYARYSCEYRIRKASQEYLNALLTLIFLPLSLDPTVQGVLMCIPHSVAFAFPSLEPFRARNPEEHQLCAQFSLLRRVKTQKYAKTRKHSLSKRNTLM